MEDKQKPKLWHTADELKGYHGCSIIFLSWDGGYFHQASYYGHDFKNDMPKFQSNGLTVDNRDIWLWCEEEIKNLPPLFCLLMSALNNAGLCLPKKV